MVLAAGLGTRLRPLTYEITKPMVPVLDRPVMEHIVDLIERHPFDGVIANLHYFPETIREHFGERITYRFEEELLGTAGGVRACADFFGDEPFLVISGDALTDIDLTAFAARHREAGGIATLAVKRVADTREYGVVLHDRDGRITGFQEKPAPEEALSDLGNCGIYMFDPRIFDYFPDTPFVDWAKDVFPALLDQGLPLYGTLLGGYLQDTGTPPQYRKANWDTLAGKIGTDYADNALWVGNDAEIAPTATLSGRNIIGQGAVVGVGASLTDCIVWDGARIGAGAVLTEAIIGRGAAVEAGATPAAGAVLA